MLPLLLFNVISGLVMDKAQDLAKDHVEEMIDNIFPKDAKKELDKVIKEDISMKDGKILPIELSIKIKYDPSTGSVEVMKS